MKNTLLEVPHTGMTVRLVLRAGAPSGQAVIVASDDVEIRSTESAPARAINKSTTPKAPARDLDFILKRLRKLKPAKRTTAANSIKAMFQFSAPITDEDANEILDDLRKQGSLTIDANGKIKFHNT